ncbi:hypothetical protein GCM10023325_10340 [Sphingomonas lutea]
MKEFGEFLGTAVAVGQVEELLIERLNPKLARLHAEDAGCERKRIKQAMIVAVGWGDKDWLHIDARAGALFGT